MPKTRSSWGSNSPAARKGYRTLRYWADKHDGRGYRRCCKTIKGTKRDGDAELARLRIMHDEDQPAPTVRECYEKWYLPDVKERVTAGTANQYMSAWRAHVEPQWGHFFVTDVKPLDVQEWLLSLTKSQADISYKVLNAVLEYPVMFEMLNRNPMRVKYRMPSAGKTHDKKVYDLGQALMILEGARGCATEAAIILALFGSCRVGESLAPLATEVEEVRASNGMVGCIVPIYRQIAQHGKVIDATKTAESKRKVVLVGKPAERLIEIANERKKSGLHWLTDNGCYEPMPQRFLAMDVKKAAESVGLTPISSRNLRNSWRTFMEWDLHIDADKLEILMGHKLQGVSGRHYNRPNESMLLDAVADAYAKAGHNRALREK